MKQLLFYLPKITKNLKFIFTVQLIAVLLWALIYQLFFNNESDLIGKLYYGNSLNSFLENVYFSTLTFFSVGYGGIRPISISCKLVCTINMFVTAYIMAYTLNSVEYT